MKNDWSRRAALTIFMPGALAAGTAAADDLYGPFATPHTVWSVFAGATRTDDATLVPGGPSDTIATAGVAASVYRDTGRLKADIDGSVHYEDYLDNTYTSRTLGHAVANVAYAFVPDRFVWTLQDTYGQANANPLQPTTPLNRINANYVTTGPDAFLRVASDLDVLLGARYAKASFGSTPFAQVDSHTLSGNLGVRSALSATSAVSLNATVSQIKYEELGDPTYDQADLFARYDARSQRGGIALDLGASQLRDAGANVTAPLVRLTLFHRLTPSWNVNLSGGSQFQNSGTALQSAFGGERVVNGQLVNGPAPPGVGTQGGTVADINLSQAPFRAVNARLAFDFIRSRTSFDVAADIARQRYQFGANGLDRNSVGAGTAFTRRLRENVDFHVYGNYERRMPLAVLPADRTTTGSAGFDWRAGALLSLTLSFSRELRSTEAGGLGYSVNRAYLGFNYGPPAPRVVFTAPGQNATGVSSP